MPLRTKGVFGNETVSAFTASIPYVDKSVFIDVDRNGSMDAVVFGGSFPGRSEEIARPAYVFLSTGSSYTISQLPGHLAVQTRSYEFADFNADGNVDLFVSTHGYDTAPFNGEREYFYLGTGAGFADANGMIPSIVSFSHGSGHGDIDGDGDIDLVSNSLYQENAPIAPFALVNDGNGNFTLGAGLMPTASIEKSDYSHERYHWMSMADVNGDGRPDLIVGREHPSLGHPNLNNKVYFNTGNGFANSSAIDLPDHPGLGANSLLTDSIGADLDGDGDLDLIMGGHTANPYGGNWYVQTLMNDGSGRFLDTTLSSIEGPSSGSGIWMNDFDFRDINGDGYGDIVVASYSGGVPSANDPLAWLGNGLGNFTPLLISDVVPTDKSFLAGSSSLVWDGKVMSLLSFQADGNSIKLWEIEAISVPQVDFGARAQGDVYRNIDTAESLDGGGGVDTFAIAGNKADTVIAKTGGILRVTTSDVTDTLSNFERISFSDGTLALDYDGNAGQGYRIYQAAFDRTPDTAGLDYWVNQIDNGVSILQVAAGFVQSGEFRSVYGSNPSDAEFIDKLYENVLGRDGEAGGFSYWVGQMQQGASRAFVLASFSESQENVVGVLPEIENGIWLG